MGILPEGMKLKWYGHSSFFIQSAQGLKILVDPWLEHPKAPEGAKQEVMERGVDVIFITHGHMDHVGNTVEVAKGTGAKVVSIFEVMLYLAGQGLPEEQLVGMNKGGTFAIGDVKATMVDATHSSGINTDQAVIPGGEAAGFIFRFENGYTIYHTGDTGLFGGLEYIRELFQPDLLLLPIGDLFTLDPELGAFFAKQVAPKHIVPMHWGTFPLLTGTPDQLKQALGDWAERVVALEPGGEL